MEWIEDIDSKCTLDAYKRSRKRLAETDTSNYSDSDKTQLNGMLSSLDYAIEWMETGRRPGNKRGVERLAAYQREIPVDVMERYANKPAPLILETDDSRDQDYVRMEYILSLLSDRERECYELHVGGMHTEYEIADMLGIKRASVQEFLRRAETKIKKRKVQPMPMLLDVI